MRASIVLPKRASRRPDGIWPSSRNGQAAPRSEYRGGARGTRRDDIAVTLMPAPRPARRPGPDRARRGARPDPRRVGTRRRRGDRLPRHRVRRRRSAAEDELERAFWKATSIRVKRIRDGRAATVRGELDARRPRRRRDLVRRRPIPKAAVIRSERAAALREFAATLTDGERRVLVCQVRRRARRRAARVLVRASSACGSARSASHGGGDHAEARALRGDHGRRHAVRAPRARTRSRSALRDRSTTRRSGSRLRPPRSCPACRIEHAARLRAIAARPAPARDREPAAASADGRPHARGRARLGRVDRMDRAGCSPRRGPDRHADRSRGRGLGTIAATKLAAWCIGGYRDRRRRPVLRERTVQSSQPSARAEAALVERTQKVVHTRRPTRRRRRRRRCFMAKPCGGDR